MTQAFSGIQILDFTQVFAGPFAVMQLALLGADVIKIEQPGTGDQTRGLMNAGTDQNQSPSFLTMNANKRSLTLNLKSPEAVNLIKRLIETTDVVVENFKAGTMTKLGLDYESLESLEAGSNLLLNYRLWPVRPKSRRGGLRWCNSSGLRHDVPERAY